MHTLFGDVQNRTIYIQIIIQPADVAVLLQMCIAECF